MVTESDRGREPQPASWASVSAMEATTSAVSYRPYKSKRHSRTVSATEPPLTPPTPPAANVDLPASVDPPAAAPAPRPAPPSNGHPAPPEPAASSSKLSPPRPPTSTFRHVPLRTASQPHAPSPLRPKPAPASHSLTVSPSFSRRFDAAPPRSRVSSTTASEAGPSTRTASPASVTPPSTRPSSTLPSPSPAPSPPPPPPPPPPAAQPSPRIPTAPVPAPTPSSTPASRRPPAPYRPGFQPKGVYRPRTDDFLAARNAVRDRDKVEQRRLERRLEKLIALHFPSDPGSAPEKPPATRRASSLFDLDFSKNPADLWRNVVESRIQGSKADIRAEEQNITPWQDDAAVAQCPLCTTSFHPLTNRKHHCRLCGRIVCALPPRPPARAQMCSLLFVVDQPSGRIEEVGEGVDYGVRRKGEDDRFLRGVRICRDCRGVLLRKQYLQDANHVPTYVRLYSTLTTLEKEIEDALPHFQELVLSLSTNVAPSTSSHAPTAAMRTRLLTSFGEYDRLAKRIRQLPAPRGGSQDRVQGAILARANLFLQTNMFPLQARHSLPKPRVEGAREEPAPAADADAALAHSLQPLLEQEALLEAFVEEARAQRKFEDARTLKTSLSEIRAEIERVAHGKGV